MKFLQFLKRHIVTAVILLAIVIATAIGVVRVIASTANLSPSISNYVFSSMTDSCSITLKLSNITLDDGASIKDWTVEDYDPNIVNLTLSKTSDFEYTLSGNPSSPGSTSATVCCNLTNGEKFTTSVAFSVPLFIVNQSGTTGILTAAYTEGDYTFDGDTFSITVNSTSALWKSSYTEVAAQYGDIVVNQQDKTSTATFICKSGGVSTITATVGSYTISVTVTVGVKIDKTRMDVDDETGGLIVKQGKTKYVYTNSSSAGAVYFWSDDEDVATIDENGKVTGKYAGSTFVYASCIEGEIKTMVGGTEFNSGDRIRVDVPFEIEATDPMIVNKGDTFTVPTTAKNTDLLIESNDPSIVSYNYNTNVLTAYEVGETDIKVSKKNEPGTAKTIHVFVVDGISLNHTELSILKGNSATIEATVTNELEPITWSVSDPSIATITVSPDGRSVTVLGLETGKATVVASQIINGVVKTVSCNVNVENPVAGLKLFTMDYDPITPSTTISLGSGKSTLLIAQILTEDGNLPENSNLTWTSSDESVLTCVPNPATNTNEKTCKIVAGANGGYASVYVVSEDGGYIAVANFYVVKGVTGITLGDDDKKTIEVQLQLKNYQLNATIMPDVDGVDKTVLWDAISVGSTQVATVDDKGMVTFLHPGTVQIHAVSKADPSVDTYCYFTVLQQVEGIELLVDNITLNVGENFMFQAKLLPLDPAPSNPKIHWSSSNPAVCTIDDEGVVHAVASGSATIVAQTDDGGYIAMANVKVLQPVTSITLSDTEMVVKKGTVFYLGATCHPDTADDKSVTWTSSDTSLATVDQNGKVTAVGVGSVTITCTSNESGAVAYCLVEITEPVTGLELNSYYEKLVKDSKFVIIPTVLPNDAPDKSVTYLSSDPDVAMVDENGIVTALKGGTAHILVTTNESHLTKSCTIVVEEFVESVEITGAKELLNVGDDMELGVIVLTDTASNKEVIWSTSDKKIATVDKNGRVHGVKAGKVVITAVAADGSGASDSVVIRVINPVKEIKLSEKKITIYVGDTFNVVATVLPDEASIKELRWESDDPTIAMAYQDGDIVGMAPGRTVVRVHSTDGNDVQAQLTVIVKPIVLASNIMLNSGEITMLKGKTRSLVARIYPFNTNETINWMSSDTSIVQVDPNGNIVTVGAGTADVIAYSSRGTVQSKCTVHSIAMHTTSLAMEQYDTYNLYVDGAVKNVSWRTSNPRVATVTQDGVVIGRMPGECTITATTDNKTVTCYVRIYPVDPDKFIHTLNDK